MLMFQKLRERTWTRRPLNCNSLDTVAVRKVKSLMPESNRLILLFYFYLIIVNGVGVMWQAWNEYKQVVCDSVT